jgi:hypothetical protein
MSELRKWIGVFGRRLFLAAAATAAKGRQSRKTRAARVEEDAQKAKQPAHFIPLPRR